MRRTWRSYLVSVDGVGFDQRLGEQAVGVLLGNRQCALSIGRGSLGLLLFGSSAVFFVGDFSQELSEKLGRPFDDVALFAPATGVRDQVEQGRDYGAGFWTQQWQGWLRLIGRA